MPEVEYLGATDLTDAVRWNLLWSEYDRKIGLALDGKSMFVPNPPFDSATGLVGKMFLFSNGTRVYSRAITGLSNYDHTPFTEFASSAVEISRNEETMMMAVEADSWPLNDSLEAHKREGFYLATSELAEGGQESIILPEKHYKYAVAELIYEGRGYETVNFPRNYDKFNFFRIHNLNAYEMQFRFDTGSGFEEFTVSAMGCITVRRDSVSSGYLSGFSYVWKVKSGDPRFFVAMCPARTPANSAIPNNVHNPAIAYLWVSAFMNGAGGSGKWYLDPHVYNDASDIYCPDYFPDPNDTTKPFGDFIHHKGLLQIRGYGDFNFNGYATLRTDIPALGATYQSDGRVRIRPQGDVTAVSTNLISPKAGSSPTMVIATEPRRFLDNDNASFTNLVTFSSSPVFAHNSTTQVPFEKDVLQIGTTSPSGSPISFWRDTLADALTFSYCGAGSTNAMTISEASLKITPLGPRILCNQEFEFSGSYYSASATTGKSVLIADMYAEPMGNGIRRKSFVQFHGNGWPSPNLSSESTLDVVQYANPAFLSPRFPRAYSDTTLSRHPNIRDPFHAANGQDFSVSRINNNLKHRHYAILTAVQPEDYQLYRWRSWSNPDSLASGMPRVPLLREHYNAMAQTINSVRRITPLVAINYVDGFLLDSNNLRVLVRDTEGGEDEVLAMPPQNNNGVLGGYCPASMYASFSLNDTSYRFFRAIGCTIKTEADLPDDYHDAVADPANVKQVRVEIIDKTISGTGSPPPSTWTYQFTHSAGGTSTHDIGQTPSIQAVTGFYWVTIADVKARVEALGWKFQYRGTFNTYEIVVQDFTPTELFSFSGSKTLSFTAVIQFGTDPNSLIGIETKGYHEFNYNDRRAIFVESPNGEWKLPNASPIVSEAEPAGRKTPVATFYDVHLDQYCSFVDSVQDPGVLLALGFSRFNTANYRRYAMVQNYHSSGMEDTSFALQIPVEWLRHADTESVRNPTYEEVATNAAVPDIALVAEEKNGSTTIATLENGDKRFSFRANQSIEIVPIYQVYLDAEAEDEEEEA